MPFLKEKQLCQSQSKMSFSGHDEYLLIVCGSYINIFMINKGAETLPNKDAQAYKQLAVNAF